ncbi:exopolyphosphatase PRUNE1-like [Ptychodera flava]|uniref:exopolyphosphatase PRUNE1-like n=1 Tax=Ptychodera flava TaxID=63121 RepID=UPI00396A9916
MVGSCATLITEKIVNTDASVLTEEVSTLLIGTILLDTVNFDPAVGKTTSKDVAMVEQLTEQFPSLDKNELYESLQSAKCDLSGLYPDEILLKDLKCLSNDVIKLGFSSITLHLEKFLQNDNVIEDFKSFCASHDIDILVIMAISIDEGTTTRQLAIYAHRHDNIKNDIIFKLECSIAPDLDLSPMVTSFEEITAYYQGNITASRKKVLPIFTEFLENMNTDTVREKDTVPSSSDLMDLDSDTLSAKSSGLSELTSEPSTTANTPAPSSPQKSIDLLGLDPFALAPSTQPNDNANNNADQDPFGVLDTQLPPKS